MRHLHLSSTTLTDDALPDIAALSGLIDLQTWGNNFADIRQLARLDRLERLYLKERNLTVGDLDFVELLTNLKWLVLKGMAITDEEFAALQERLPTVSLVR